MDVKDTVLLVFAVSSAAAVITRLLVSMYQIQQDVPRPIRVSAAVLIGIAASLLYLLAGGGTLTVHVIAVSVLAGIIAAGESEGLAVSHEAAARAVRVRAAVRAALRRGGE